MKIFTEAQIWNIFPLIKGKKCKEFQVIKNGIKYSAIVEKNTCVENISFNHQTENYTESKHIT